MKALLQRIEQHDLQPRFGRVLVPSETVVDPKTKRKVTRRFYPGYMLVEMDLDNETWHLVKNTPKVDGFVGGTRNPPPVPESEVARITIDAGRGRGAEAGDGLRGRRGGPAHGGPLRVDARRRRRGQRGARQAARRHQHVRSPLRPPPFAA